MRNLLEGMRGGDLEDLILPLVSVDEFVSKIDTTALVLGFYVNEHGAAEDLNRFIQRSPVELLDSEISPAPDQHGFYMVFVEILGNDQFPTNVAALLDEIAPLANISGWKMNLRGQDDLEPFSEEVLADYVAKLQGPDSVTESVLNYLRASDLRDAALFAGTLTLTATRGKVMEFRFVDFGPTGEMLTRYLNESIALDFSAGSNTSQLQAMLGSNWLVHTSGDNLIVQDLSTDDVLMLQVHT